MIRGINSPTQDRQRSCVQHRAEPLEARLFGEPAQSEPKVRAAKWAGDITCVRTREGLGLSRGLPCLMTSLSSFAIKEPLPGTAYMPGSGGGRIVVFRVCRDRSRVGSTAVFTLGLNGYACLRHA